MKAAASQLADGVTALKAARGFVPVSKSSATVIVKTIGPPAIHSEPQDAEL